MESSFCPFLVTYPDSLGGNLVTLARTLESYFKGVFRNVHILPFYPSSGDRGFAPLTHNEIDEGFGTWEDMRSITSKFGVMADVVIGHLSTESLEFKDVLKNGRSSKYFNIFFAAEKIFENGSVPLDTMVKLCHYTKFPPFMKVECENGEVFMIFKSYLPQQADLDFHDSGTRAMLLGYLDTLASNGIKHIRLDAIETIIKDAKLGYNDIPKKVEIIKWLASEISSRGMTTLAEAYVGKKEAVPFRKLGCRLYDYRLYEYVFYSLFTRRTAQLGEYISTVDKSDYVYLGLHDGLCFGLNELDVPLSQKRLVRDQAFINAGEMAREASGDGSNNINSASINTTVFDALGRNRDLWFFAHALVLFCPGIPLIYYNDLLQSENDVDLYRKTREGRSMVRHNFSVNEILSRLKNSSVQAVLELVKLRSFSQAFAGEVKINAKIHDIEITWSSANESASLFLDLERNYLEISTVDGGRKRTKVWNSKSMSLEEREEAQVKEKSVG